jgi:hypothetical protein
MAGARACFLLCAISASTVASTWDACCSSEPTPGGVVAEALVGDALPARLSRASAVTVCEMPRVQE